MIIPIILGKPLHIWIGALAAILVAWQMYLGVRMHSGKWELLKYHKWNAWAIGILIFAHIFIVFGLMYLNFKIGR